MQNHSRSVTHSRQSSPQIADYVSTNIQWPHTYLGQLLEPSATAFVPQHNHPLPFGHNEQLVKRLHLLYPNAT